MAFITRLELHDEKFCQSYGEVLTLSGLTRISSIGKLQYTTNQSGSYIARSVPDVEYVTGLTNNLSSRLTCIENNYVTGGTNGLSKTGKNLKLGGPLTESTTITGSYFINFCNGAKLNTQLGYSISGSTMLRNSQRTLTSVFVGYNTCSNGTGVHNVGFGACVLSGNTIGFNNVGIGGKALTNNTGGYDNIGIGFSSMCSETDAINNIGIGAYSLSKLTSGSGNIAMGCNSMYCCAVVGCENIGIGSNVMKSLNSGCFNIGIGSSGMQSIHTGYNNIGIGHEVLNTLSNGCDNIAIGNCSGYNTDGCNNVYIGKYAGNNGTGSNKFYLSNSASCNLIFGDFTGNTVTLPALKLCTTPVNGASNDYILVWNNADKSVKKILSSAILAGGVTGATNGVTQVGQKVKLGGALTGDTNIALTQKNLSFTGSYLTECYMDKSPANNGGFISKYSASSGGTDVVSEIINGFDNTTISVRNPNTPFECQAINLSLCNGMRVIDTANCKGLVYDTDYSNNFTNESLVTKRFVTGQTTTAGIQYAGNGLTKLGSTAVLGGELTGDTTIYGCNRNFGLGYFNNYLSGFRIYANDVCQYGLDEYTICSVNQINLMSDDDITLKGGSVSVCALANYNTDYSNSYTARSLVDKAFVTGLTNNINLDITYLSGVTDNIIQDITYVSGVTDNIIQDITYVSGVTSGNTVEISGIHQDITGLNHTLSGHTGNTTIHHTPEEIKTIIGIDTVSGSSSIFLNKKGDFINIPVVGNGSSSNVYFTTLDSEETGYKLLSYTLEPTETTLSATFSNTTHLVQKYLYPQGVTTTLLPAGTYDFNFYASSNKAGSSIIIEFFKRSVGDVDTVLFSGASTQEITSTINRISIILSEIGYPVDPTDRVGINVYFKSGNNNTTMNLIIGDGRGAYWKGTAMPRHSDIRDKNGEQSFQHIDNSITASGITTNDKFTIYSSNLGKYVSVDRNTYLSWLSNLYVPVVNGSTDNAIARFDGITGKLIQNSGIVIDDSNYMGFGVAPTAQITQTSTAALESAPLGSELLTSANWTTTDWTGDFINGFTHTTGNVTPLTNTLAALNNTLYQIAFTVTNRTAGSFTVTFGNENSGTYTASNAWGVKTTGTGTLSITPTTDFNGTIVISIKRIIGTYNPTYQILDSTGIGTLEIRSSLNTLNNTFIGKGAGRYNTTGSYNSVQGVNALYSNTTGSYNSVQGVNALYYNTTGYYNSAQGAYALSNNTTGYQNSVQGVNALYSNTTGYQNSAQGFAALYYNTTGYYNSTQGAYALSNNTTGSFNSAQGVSALRNNTTGSNNSAQGFNALYSNTTGSYNSAQGREAGSYLADGVTANQTSNNSVFLGYNTKSKQAGQTNEIVIGANAIGNGSNTATIGHTNVTDIYLRGNIHLETTPLSGAGTDSILVYNTSDCYVKSISTSDVLSSAILTANNGLTKSGQNVRLGGVLTGNTGISGAYTMGFNNTYLNLTGTSGVYISGPTKLLSTPANGVGSDSILVWNSTDKCIKSISCSTINAGNITTANNGLTKSGQNVHLGGPLTGNTSINGGEYSFNLGSLNNCLGSFVVCSSSLQANPTGNGEVIPTGSLTLGGSSVTLNNFATYNNNYSSLFTKYSLVDKNYVTGLTSTLGIQTANNGLTKSGLNVRLGGSLTGDTGINGSYTMGFNNCMLYLTGTSGVHISGPTKLMSAPTAGVGTDGILVWNSTDKCVKTLTCACLNAGNVTTANNGLTKSGQNVRLGGTLTGGTTINGGGFDFNLGINGSLVNNYNVCSTNSLICSSGNANIFGNSITLKGGSINSCGLINYNIDYSGSYTTRSLVDKGYVTGLTSNINTCLNTINSLYLTGATNGLSLASKKIKLGGTLTETTTINGGSYALNLGALNNCLGTLTICSTSTSIIPTGALTLGGGSISLNNFASYNNNYSSSFTKYSLVDKNYVTGITSTLGIQTANNGLTKSGLNVRLGGALTGNTGISGAYTMGFNNTYLNLTGTSGVYISGPTKLLSTPASGVGTDSILVWNSTDKCVKSLTCACLNASNIQTANNGLTKSGQNVRLGGTLTGNTIIAGATHDFTLGCNTSLINNYNVYTCNSLVCSSGNANIFSDGVLTLKGATINSCNLISYYSDYSASYTNRSLVDKEYVDSVATGLDVKVAVKVATIGNITLSGLQTIDGIALSAGDRVLVKNQTTQWRNGIYDASSGAWVRSSDYDFSISSEINNGDLISVLSGNTNANSIWALTSSNPIISGTTNLVFTKFMQQSGVVSGNGICVTNSGINKEISVKLDTNSGLQFNSNNLSVNWNNYRAGLCVNNYKVDLRVSRCTATGSEIPVAINTGGTNTLYIDSACINTILGNPITTANNGLTKSGQNVRLGGSLTGNTIIAGAAHDFTLGCNTSLINSFNICTVSALICSTGNISLKGTAINACALANYNTDYSGSYTNRSLVDKGYVTGLTSNINTCLNTINSLYLTGATNGLSLASKKVKLGGTLTETTTINGGGYGLNLGALNNCLGALIMCSTSASIIPTGALTLGGGSISLNNFASYNNNYSGSFTKYSLVDKNYVTGLTSTLGIQTANNGLTKSGLNVRLGGSLTGDTGVNGLYTMGFNNTYLNLTGTSGVYISGPTKLLSTPATGVGTDNVLVWNSTDKCVKSISCSCINAGNITTANNGLTKSGQNVRLGGSLTGNTIIAGAAHDFTIGCNSNLINNYNVCSVTNTQCATGNINIFSGGVLSLKGNSVCVCALSNYNSDYSGSYTARSLVDKGYVTGLTNTINSCLNTINSLYLTGATNGLSLSAKKIKLGGTLTEATTINGGGYALNLGLLNNCLGVFTVCSSSSSIIPTGTLTLGGSSVTLNNFATYNNNYSSSFTKYSLVDKNYVTGVTSSLGVQTANNGLTKSGLNVRLGGSLTGNTGVNGAYTMGFNNTILNLTGSTCVNISGPTKLLSTPSSGVGTDDILVWNSTDKSIKSITCACINAGNITTANNGLNKVGQNVRLGGSLTGDTGVNGAYSMGFNNSYLNLTGSTCVNISGPTKLLSTPSTGVNSDDFLVWNSTDKYVKSINVPGGIVNTITGLTSQISNKFTFSGDTFGNKKTIGSIDNQDFGIITNNTERITVLKNGNVGIGRTNPDYKLDVNFTSMFRDSVLFGSHMGRITWDSPGFIIMAGSNIKLNLGGGGRNSDLVIDRIGNVGIGKTNPFYKLDVSGTTATDYLKLLSTPSTGINADDFLVWNSTDKSVKKINVSGGIVNTVTGHTQQISNIKNIMVTGATSSTDNAIARFDGTTGKLIQNSGVIIDDTGNMGFGITPTAQITQTSTAALESAPLGAELLTSSNWTTTDWTGNFINGFTHTTGNVTPLTNTLAVLNAALYQIAFTVTNRTTGSFTVTFGNETSGTYTSSNAWGVKTTGTGTLSITPTSDFNGTIVISIKRITGTYAPTYQILDSTGISTIEIRSSLNTLYNTFIGKGAGRYNITGSNNSAQGGYALYSNTTGSYNSAQGVYALQNNTTGSYNSAQGVYSLYSNTTGSNNSAQGFYALSNNTTGYQNSAQGVNALRNNTTGSYNSAQGFYALSNNTTGSNNSAQGAYALYSNTTGSNNSAQGFYALSNNTTGSNNSAQGAYALSNNTTGYQNSAQGVNAGRYLADGVTANQTSNNSVFLGYNTKSKQAGQTNEIVIGANAIGNGSNTATIGHTDVTDTYLRGNIHLETTPLSGNTSDGVLVWNSTDKMVKLVSNSVITGGTISTANNGLTKSGSNVRLGGVLTGNTAITGAYAMGFSNSYLNLTGSTCVNISGPTKLLSTPSSGAGTDSILVWNSTDKTIKSITCACINSGNITTANNGLTKSGQNVRLGGTLTGNTTINTSTSSFNIYGNGLYDICTCVVNSCAGNGGSVYTQICQTNSLLYLNHCNVSQSKYSNISLCNGEIKQVSSLNNCITASNCISGAVVNTGTTGYDITPIYSKLYFGATAYQAVCNDGTSDIYGLNGVNITTPSSNGIILTGTLKLDTVPTTGTNTDSVLVYNSADKRVKSLGFGEFGDKNNIYSMSVIDSATGLTNSSPYVILVNHTLPVTIDLPASPTNGIVFKIKDASSVGAYDYNITIARNGKLIDRQTKDALINTDGGSIELVYNSTLGSWFTLSFIN